MTKQVVGRAKRALLLVVIKDIPGCGVLIDFNKACSVENGRVYRLTYEQQRYYMKHYPQVAPEVRRGVHKQSFASDIYALGRVLQKIDTVLKVPCLYKMLAVCLEQNHSGRPSAEDLNTFFSNLFT